MPQESVAILSVLAKIDELLLGEDRGQRRVSAQWVHLQGDDGPASAKFTVQGPFPALPSDDSLLRIEIEKDRMVALLHESPLQLPGNIVVV